MAYPSIFAVGPEQQQAQKLAALERRLSAMASNGVTIPANAGASIDLINGGFEDDFNGWTVTTGDITIDDTVARFGVKSLKLVASGATNIHASQTIYLPPGKHVVSAWVKTASMTGAQAALNIDASGGVATITDASFGPATDWTRVQAIVDVSTGGNFIVYAQLLGAGTVWFDNITVETPRTAYDISVNTLSAISADMGTINAGTITGATMQTALSGARTVIDATGLRSFAATDGSGNAQKYRWIRDSSGSVIGQVYSFAGSDGRSTFFQEVMADNSVICAMFLRAITGGKTTELKLENNPALVSSLGKRQLRVSLDADSSGTFDQLILGSTGFSSFMQLGQAAYWRMDGGNTAVSITGTAGVSVTVNHNCGVVPSAITAVATDQSDTAKSAVVAVRTVTSTQITFTLRRPFGATTTDTHLLYWMAFG